MVATDPVSGFRQYLLESKKSSANTVESYLRDVNQFAAYCDENRHTGLCEADSALLRRYFDYLGVLGKSEATVTRILASLRCFYRYLQSVGDIGENPADGIRMQRSERKLPGILDANEVVLLLSQPDVREYKGVRDKAMLELLYATGIKVSELIDLDVSDVNLQVGILHMKNSRRERIIPIYPAAVKAISTYLVRVRPAIVLDEDEDRLFTNMNGQPMSRQGFWKIIKHYSAMAGIDKDITPHTLRHSFAAHLLENGAQLKDIQEMLGHSDISSTQVYAQFIKGKYTQAYARFHPLAK